MEILVLLFSSFIPSTQNPVKMSVYLLLTTASMMTYLWMESSMSWVTLMMFLLFTGGILVMFMILSSFHPNEKMNKVKTLLFVIPAFLGTYITTEVTPPMSQDMLLQFKMFFNSTSTSVSSMMVVLMYFYIFMKIMTKKQNSMRMVS